MRGGGRSSEGSGGEGASRLAGGDVVCKRLASWPETLDAAHRPMLGHARRRIDAPFSLPTVLVSAVHLVVVVVVKRVGRPFPGSVIGLGWLVGVGSPVRGGWKSEGRSAEGFVLTQLVQKALREGVGIQWRRRMVSCALGRGQRDPQRTTKTSGTHDVERHAVPLLLRPPDRLLKRRPLREHDVAADD